MSNHLATEQELRRALQSLAPEDLDVSRFRQRLDGALGDQAPTRPLLPADQVGAATALAWPAAERSNRRRWTEVTVAVALAACAAVVVAALFGALSPKHSGSHGPAAKPPVPDAIRSILLPGSIVLDSYQGRGSQSFPQPARVIPPHFGYSAYGSCSGNGTLTIGQQTIIDACQAGKVTFGTSGAVTNGRLAITADSTMSWQIVLALTPDIQTNGSVQGPIDADLTGPDNPVRRSGQGSATVTFAGETPAPPAGSSYRLRLVCHGSGVTLPDLRTVEANGLQTKTCFVGHEYVWDGIRFSTPLRVRVQATADTSWTIAIDSM
jgi:hypothetical protein